MRGVPTEQARHDRDVVRDRHVREEADFLEHVADAASQVEGIPLTGVAAFDEHVAAIGAQQAVDEFQQRALAGAAAANERDRLPRRDGQVNPAQDGSGCAARQVHLTERDRRIGRRIHRAGDSIAAVRRLPVGHASRACGQA